jgi:hypothetical protein
MGSAVEDAAFFTRLGIFNPLNAENNRRAPPKERII